MAPSKANILVKEKEWKFKQTKLNHNFRYLLAPSFHRFHLGRRENAIRVWVGGDRFLNQAFCLFVGHKRSQLQNQIARRKFVWKTILNCTTQQ